MRDVIRKMQSDWRVSVIEDSVTYTLTSASFPVSDWLVAKPTLAKTQVMDEITLRPTY